MSDESFVSGFGHQSGPVRMVSQEDGPLTAFSYLHDMPPCMLKVLWKSPGPEYQSFAFQKDSPILPFFKHVYSKIRQSGILYKLKEKWKPKGKEYICSSRRDILKPISLNKVGSILALLLIGGVIAAATLAFEYIYEARFKALSERQKILETIGHVEIFKPGMDSGNG